MSDSTQHADTKPHEMVGSVIALSLVCLFALSHLLPYFQRVPDGEGGTIIIGSSKVIESIIMLIIGYYFGSTRGSEQKSRALADQASTARTLAENTTPPQGPAVIVDNAESISIDGAEQDPKVKS